MSRIHTGRATASSLLAVAFMVAAQAAHALTVVTYDDRASWRTAAGGGTGDIEDDLDTGDATRAAFVFAGYLVPNTNGTTDIDGTPYARALINGPSGDTPADVASMTFDAPILALGFDINPWCNGGVCGASTSLGARIDVKIDGEDAGYFTLPETYEPGFIGFVSETAFTTFEISTPDASGWHGADNVEAFSAASPVPLPLPGALLMTGLAGWAGASRLRRRA